MIFRHKLSRFIATFLAFILVFVSLIHPSTAEARSVELSNENLQDVEILADNDQEIKLKTTVDGFTGILVQDKNTLDITLTTYSESLQSQNSLIATESKNEESSEQYFLSVDDYSQRYGATLTFENEETGEKATISKDYSELKPQAVFLAPLVVVVGAKLIEGLLLVSAVILINELEFAKTDSIAMSLRNKRQYDHYYAKILSRDNDVWIGPAISLSHAATRLVSFNGDAEVTGRDVWSTTLSGAAKVAQRAGGNKEPVGPEIHGGGLGFGYYYHYHTWNRVGGHSFF